MRLGNLSATRQGHATLSATTSSPTASYKIPATEQIASVQSFSNLYNPMINLSYNIGSIIIAKIATMPRQYTRLSHDEWKALLGLYQTGINTVEELAERYKVSSSSIAQKARAAGVVRQARFTAAAGIASATSALATLALPAIDHTSTQDRIKASNDAAYSGCLMIQRVLEASIAALAIPATPTDAAVTIRSLEQAAAVQERVNKVRRVVLRMDKENGNADAILPELPIRDMTTAEVRARRAEQERQDREVGIGRSGLDVGDEDSAPLPVEVEKEDDRIAEGCEDEIAWP